MALVGVRDGFISAQVCESSPLKSLIYQKRFDNLFLFFFV